MLPHGVINDDSTLTAMHPAYTTKGSPRVNTNTVISAVSIPASLKMYPGYLLEIGLGGFADALHSRLWVTCVDKFVAR